MRARLLLVLALLGGCRKTPEPPRILQLQTYLDLRHKISLEYPAPWALTRELPSALPGPDFGLQHPPSAVFSVGRADEPRLHASDFSGAELIYAVRSNLAPEACAALAGPSKMSVGGSVFDFGEQEHADGPHRRRDHVYAVTQGPYCFLFDLALLRESATAVRPMTDREQADVQTELTQLLSSVSFQ